MKTHRLRMACLALGAAFLAVASCFPGDKSSFVGDRTFLHDAPSTTHSSLSSIFESKGGTILPSKGNPNILVVPVSFAGGPGFSANDLSHIQSSFFGDGSHSGWESVSSYYSKSSYGKLSLGGVVADVVDLPKSASAYAEGNGDLSSIMSEILNFVYTSLDSQFGDSLSTHFDSDGNGILDGVWLVYDEKDNSSQSSFLWAFTGWNASSVGGVKNPINVYCWASKDFLNKDRRLNGQDAHTFIHETGHLLGLEDYYDTTYGNVNPFGGLGMMDNNILDLDAYSKWSLGWIDPVDIVKSDQLTSALSVDLAPFQESGDALVVALPDNRGWYGEEYVILEYYTPAGLNAWDSEHEYGNTSLNPLAGGSYPRGYTESGVIAYHVDSRVAILHTDDGGRNSTVKSFVQNEADLSGSLPGSSTSFDYYNLYMNNDGDPSGDPYTTPFLISIYDASNRYRNLVNEGFASQAVAYADNSFLYQSSDVLTPDSVFAQKVHAEAASFGVTITFGAQTAAGATITLSRV